MPPAAAGLARITINAPKRRVDVAVPDAVPLAELLPELLHHAGDGLADEGERHGGWLLRRADGTALASSVGLADQDVRDGAVLHLVAAHKGWPELEYDDVVEAIAADARRQGLRWSPAATRTTALGIAAAGLVVAFLLIARADLPLAAGAVATGLMLAGVTAARAYGDALVGATLAAFALPFAFAGGWLAAPEPATMAAHALLGAVSLLLAALIATVGVAHLLRLFVAGATAGLLGSLAGLLAVAIRPEAAAAVLLAVLVAGVAGLPLLAIRLGRLPMPVVGNPADPFGNGLADLPGRGPAHLSGRGPADLSGRGSDWSGRGPADLFGQGSADLYGRGLADLSGRGPADLSGKGPPRIAERHRISAAVARTDEMLTGLLLGHALAAAGASLILARSGDVSGVVLVGVAAAALLLRARTFLTVRQRLPLIVAGTTGFALLGLFVPFDARIAAVLVPLTALVVAIAGARAAARPVSPYLGRAADLLDTLCIVAVVPVACAVLGLYGLFG